MNSKVTKLNINLGPDQQYSDQDIALINSIQLQRQFGLPEDYIELSLFDLNETLLKINYNYTGYKHLPGQLIELSVDPSNDVISEGYSVGSVIAEYNLFRKLFTSNKDNKFFIKTISTDRTELRVAINSILNSDLADLYSDFIAGFNNEAYYKDFYLNFSGNQVLIGVNLLLEEDPNQFNLLIKLYEPLPVNLQLKDTFWLVDKLSDSISYQVDFEVPLQPSTDSQFQLRGPNLNIKINEQVNPSTEYINYNSFFSTTSTSSFQQIKSLLEEKSLDINVDYTDYENFIHFSSARERLLNFAYKLKLIEEYQRDVNTLATAISTPQISSSRATLYQNINNVIEKFDGYEYYLYYESGSKAWPKKITTKPVVNYESTSSAALNWIGSDNDESGFYGGQLYSASYYDSLNQDNLLYSIPEYLRIDEQNKGYETFIHMIGQHFDNIWLHIKGMTDIHDAQNNLDKGISKDLVSYALKSLGVKLYSNTSTTSDIFSYLVGSNPSGTYSVYTGSEAINTVVTASQYSLAGSEIDKEVYKRLYHNLPYLLKTKGTERGLRALIACYGIPDTILRINEFGGTDKDSGSFEQFFNKLSYALNTKTGSVYVSTPWAPSYYQSLSSSIGSGSIVPDTIEFRFKTNGIPTGSAGTFISQSLFQVNSGSATQFGLQLTYPTQSSTGSYLEYGNIKLVMSASGGYTFSSPISLPFFNKDWWNVMIYRETGSLVSSSVTQNNRYWIYAANSIYNGSDGETIGFIGSSSIFVSGTISSSNLAWNSYNTSSLNAYLGGQDSNNIIASGSTKFSGFFQELRYWVTSLPVENFIGHTLSPLSIECINLTSSYQKLIYRLPLGTDLNITGSPTIYSIHPSYTGSVSSTGSFIMGSNIVSYGQINSPGLSLYGTAVYGNDVYFGTGTNIVYTGNTEFYYLKSGNMGLLKPTNDKIRITTIDEISGSTLSLNSNIQQNPEVELTKDINTLEISFSPSDQINNDIINQLGYFDIDNYVGDPREDSSNNYQSLKELREFYFKKYIRSYNLFDFIRLIKYYNNSLFKMIKDFIPARSNISTGITIKPHLLERSKIKRSEPSLTQIGNSGSIDMVSVNSDEGGILKSPYIYAYTHSISSTLGNINVINTQKIERFNGELKGSTLLVTDGNLQENNYIKREYNLDTNKFLHSDFNILLNNVSQSRLSSRNCYDVDYSSNPNIAVNLGLINSQSNLIKAPIQDSNYTLLRHINPRYNGTRTRSELYNIYTEGDISYGQTSVIDLNVRKLGLFTNITESKFLPRRQEARLKYLVNEQGDFTELNLLNQNWFEVQNTFLMDDTGSVSLFDVNKFGDQRTTNGEKIIFNSGYDYLPMLYFSSSDAKIYFESTGESVSKLFRATNVSGSYLSGSTVITYPISGGKVLGLFDQEDSNYTEGNTYYTSSGISASYTVPENNNYKFLSTFNISLAFTASGYSGSFTNKIRKNHTTLLVTQSLSYTSSIASAFSSSNSNLINNFYIDSGDTDYLKSFVTNVDIKCYSGSVLKSTISSGSTVYYYSGSISTTGSCAPYYSLPVTFVKKIIVNTGSSPSAGGPYNLSGITYSSCGGGMYSSTGYTAGYQCGTSDSNVTIALSQNPAVSSLEGTLSFNTTSSYDTFLTNDIVTFELSVDSFNTNRFTASIDSGEQYNQIQTSVGTFPSATTSSAPFISGSINGNTLIFNSSISSYVGYLYVPSTGSNVLYSQYSDVNNNLNIYDYDYIVLYIYNTSVGATQRYEYSILNSYTSNSKLHIQLDSTLPGSLDKGVYTSSDYSQFLLLKRLEDETMVLLNFNKKQGQTSYGIIIPSDLHKDVLKDIDSITKEAKLKLLEINNN